MIMASTYHLGVGRETTAVTKRWAKSSETYHLGVGRETTAAWCEPYNAH